MGLGALVRWSILLEAATGLGTLALFRLERDLSMSSLFKEYLYPWQFLFSTAQLHGTHSLLWLVRTCPAKT